MSKVFAELKAVDDGFYFFRKRFKMCCSQGKLLWR